MTILIILFIVGILILGLNNDNPFLDLIAFILLVVTFSVVTVTAIKNNKSKIDLPEEYNEITRDTAITGYFDKDSVLHIEFDNRIQFEWEGLEQDIPKYNTFIQMTRLYDKVYLNPIDE